jgi:hypothetical protein
MAQGRVPVRAPRPKLGYIVMDDGTTYELDMDYVLGRQPDVHPAVQAGKARGMALAADGSMSPAHTAIRLEEWEVMVMDCESATGTYVWAPGEKAWDKLGAGEARPLQTGTHVLLGGRSFVFRPVNRR